MEQLINLVKDLRDIEKDIAVSINKLRKLKAMQNIELLNTKKTTIENQIIETKTNILQDMKSKQETTRIEQVGDKQFNITILNTKDIGGKNFEYISIEELITNK